MRAITYIDSQIPGRCKRVPDTVQIQLTRISHTTVITAVAGTVNGVTALITRAARAVFGWVERKMRTGRSPAASYRTSAIIPAAFSKVNRPCEHLLANTREAGSFAIARATTEACMRLRNTSETACREMSGRRFPLDRRVYPMSTTTSFRVPLTIRITRDEHTAFPHDTGV